MILRDVVDEAPQLPQVGLAVQHLLHIGGDLIGAAQIQHTGAVFVLPGQQAHVGHVLRLGVLLFGGGRCDHVVSVQHLFGLGTGGAAAAAAFAGESGRMIALKRVSNYPYQCITESVDVQQVANLEKKVPLEWITPDGMQVTEAFEEYARPLILDEVTPVYVNGTPRHIRL